MDIKMIFFLGELCNMSKGLIDLDEKMGLLDVTSEDYEKNRMYYDVVKETMMESISNGNLTDGQYDKILRMLDCQMDDVRCVKVKEVFLDYMKQRDDKSKSINGFLKEVDGLFYLETIDKWIELNRNIGDAYEQLYELDVQGKMGSSEYIQMCKNLEELMKRSEKLFASIGFSMEALNYVDDYIDNRYSYDVCYDRCQRRIAHEKRKFLPEQQQKLESISNHQRTVVNMRMLQYLEEMMMDDFVSDIRDDLLKKKYDMAYLEANDELEKALLLSKFDVSKVYFKPGFIGDGQLYLDCLNANFVRPIKNKIRDLQSLPDNIDIDIEHYDSYNLAVDLATLMAMLEVIPNGAKIVVNRYWNNLKDNWNIDCKDSGYMLVDAVMKRKGKVAVRK